MRFDLAVIGNDEVAFEIQCLAARMGRRVIAILPESRHSSWLVGQALRRLISNLLVDRSVGRQRMFAQTGSPRLLQQLISRAIASEVFDHMEVLKSLGVEVVIGESRFESSSRMTVSEGIHCSRRQIEFRYAVVATGVRQTAMHRPLGLVPFHRPESLFEGMQLPESLCLVGGEGTGAGLAALFSLFGVQTRHVARDEAGSIMLELAEAAGVRIGFRPSEVGLAPTGSPTANVSKDVVDCRRRVGFTENLNLPAIGVEPDENGQLWCANSFETWCPGVFGLGDVVGFSPDQSLSADPQLRQKEPCSAIRKNQPTNQVIPRPHFAMNRISERLTLDSYSFAKIINSETRVPPLRLLTIHRPPALKQSGRRTIRSLPEKEAVLRSRISSYDSPETIQRYQKPAPAT